MSHKIKILIVGSSPILPTGLGEATRLIFGALLDRYPDQYELHQVGLFNSYSVATPSWPVYPTKGEREKDGRMRFQVADLYGQVTFKEVVATVQPDIVFAFNDPQRIFHLCSPPSQRKYKLLVYVTIDGMPFLPGGLEILDQADLIFTMSEFSTRVVAARLPNRDPSTLGYMYAPADFDRFKPILEAERNRLRGELLPQWMPRDAFLLGWIGRNQWRKQVWLLYQAIRYLRTGDYLLCGDCGRVTPLHPGPPGQCLSPQLGSPAGECRHCHANPVRKAEPLSDVFLWLHMPDEPNEAWSKSWLEEQFDARPGRDIHYTEGHRVEASRARADMPALYQLWDCLLYLSGGEGFGLPAWEAMCAGLPVVYTNYSSHAEFLGKAGAGLPIRGILQPEPKTCLWRMVADESQTIEAVRKLYFDRDLGRLLGASGRSFVQSFTPELQAARWHRIFEELSSSTGEKSENARLQQ